MIKSDNKRLKVLEEKSAKSVHDVFLSSVKLINCSQEACCSLQYLALASKLVKYNFVINLHLLYDLCGDNFFVVLA